MMRGDYFFNQVLKIHTLFIQMDYNKFTPREIDVLKILLKTRILCYQESTLSIVWEENFEVTERIVDVYIKNLRIKLGIDCIITVKGVGVLVNYQKGIVFFIQKGIIIK